MGAPYIGGYIRDDESKGDWLKTWTDKWERDICTLIITTYKHPQGSYAAVACLVQSEWIFLQYVTEDMGQAFAGLKIFCRKPFCLVFSLEN